MARGASRLNTDTAGGRLFYTRNRSAIVNSSPAVCNDGMVMGHDFSALISFDHNPVNVIVSASGSIFASSLPVVRAGDKGACGHACTGSSSVFFN